MGSNDVLIYSGAALIGALIGGVVSSIITAYNTKKMNRGSIISNARIDWIQKVRASLSDTVVNYRRYHDCFVDSQKFNGIINSQTQNTEIKETIKEEVKTNNQPQNTEIKEKNQLEVERLKREFLYSMESLTLYFPVPENKENKRHEELVNSASEIMKEPQGKMKELGEFKKRVSVYLKEEWDKSKEIK